MCSIIWHCITATSTSKVMLKLLLNHKIYYSTCNEEQSHMTLCQYYYCYNFLPICFSRNVTIFTTTRRTLSHTNTQCSSWRHVYHGSDVYLPMPSVIHAITEYYSMESIRGFDSIDTCTLHALLPAKSDAIRTRYMIGPFEQVCHGAWILLADPSTDLRPQFGNSFRWLPFFPAKKCLWCVFLLCVVSVL
jgi:hypothetical protein